MLSKEEVQKMEAAKMLKDQQELKPTEPEIAGKLLRDVMIFMSRFVAFSNHHQLVAIVLWIFHTYVMKAAETTPYLHVNSPEKRSGKTRLLETLELLVRCHWRVASPTEAVLFRKIEADEPTLLFDEIDTIFKDKNSSYEGIRAILNAGYRRGTTVPRCVGEGKNISIKEFPVFCAKALSGIGRIPDTVADRSIPIQLKRRSNEPVERFLRRLVEPDAAPIRERLQVWADNSADALMDALPELPEELNDRVADAWEPLLAIADLTGEEWPEKARAAAVALHEENDEESLGVLLLSHIESAFETKEKMFTAELLNVLIKEEEGPWADWWSNKVESNRPKGPASKLARLLKPFGIAPKTIRVADDRAKGYERGQFEDAWERYLLPPSPPYGEKTRDTVTPQADTPKTLFSGKHEDAQNKTSNQGCHGVTSSNPPKTGQRDSDDENKAEVSKYELDI